MYKYILFIYYRIIYAKQNEHKTLQKNEIKTFWLPDNINVKTYSKTFGCTVGQPGQILVVRQEEMDAPGLEHM